MYDSMLALIILSVSVRSDLRPGLRNPGQAPAGFRRTLPMAVEHTRRSAQTALQECNPGLPPIAVGGGPVPCRPLLCVFLIPERNLHLMPQVVAVSAMAKLVWGAFARLNADSQLKVADFAFEDPSSLKKVGLGNAQQPWPKARCMACCKDGWNLVHHRACTRGLLHACLHPPAAGALPEHL